MKMNPKQKTKPYDAEPWKYGAIVFDLGLHEIEIACKPRSERGKPTHRDEIYYVQMAVVGHVDEIIANLKVIK